MAKITSSQAAAKLKEAGIYMPWSTEGQVAEAKKATAATDAIEQLQAREDEAAEKRKTEVLDAMKSAPATPANEQEGNKKGASK